MPPNGPTGTIAINEPGPYHYGDTLTFTCSDNLKGRQYPMVAVHLFQSDELVWLQLNHPETPVILGGGSSELDASQPAKGKATLYAYSWKGGQESIVPLDSPEFDVVV